MPRISSVYCPAPCLLLPAAAPECVCPRFSLASPEHNYDQQGASEEAYSGYQMSGGMLVCDPAQGMEGMGEMGGDYDSQEHGEVAPMRRDLSGDASTWSATAFVRLCSRG